MRTGEMIYFCNMCACRRTGCHYYPDLIRLSTLSTTYNVNYWAEFLLYIKCNTRNEIGSNLLLTKGDRHTMHRPPALDDRHAPNTTLQSRI